MGTHDILDPMFAEVVGYLDLLATLEQDVTFSNRNVDFVRIAIAICIGSFHLGLFLTINLLFFVVTHERSSGLDPGSHFLDVGFEIEGRAIESDAVYLRHDPIDDGSATLSCVTALGRLFRRHGCNRLRWFVGVARCNGEEGFRS